MQAVMDVTSLRAAQVRAAGRKGTHTGRDQVRVAVQREVRLHKGFGGSLEGGGTEGRPAAGVSEVKPCGRRKRQVAGIWDAGLRHACAMNPRWLKSRASSCRHAPALIRKLSKGMFPRMMRRDSSKYQVAARLGSLHAYRALQQAKPCSDPILLLVGSEARAHLQAG